jgi:hypothetical protein
VGITAINEVFWTRGSNFLAGYMLKYCGFNAGKMQLQDTKILAANWQILLIDL